MPSSVQHSQHTLNVETMLINGLAIVADGGPTLIQHWFSVQYLLNALRFILVNDNRQIIIINMIK